MNTNNRNQIMRQSIVFAGTSIVGPILFFGGVGWILDIYLRSGHVYLYSALACAFITTHIFLYRKLKMFQKEINALNRSENKKVRN